MLAVRGLDRVLADLTDLGFDSTWGIISAKDAGLCHKRSRLWIVANSDVRGRTWREKTTERILRYASLVERQHSRSNPSGVHGANDELANRMDRLHAIGNGQVPDVVKLAWETLLNELY
jgi:DNA (cytosine-5)-methyltransferase 1